LEGKILLNFTTYQTSRYWIRSAGNEVTHSTLHFTNSKENLFTDQQLQLFACAELLLHNINLNITTFLAAFA